MTGPIERALADAVALLRELPRARARLPDARVRFERFRGEHPAVPAQLLIDRAPGAPEVDYDVLLEHPDGGTIAVCCRPDDGVPWFVEYADDLTASLALTVNRRRVTAPRAMLLLKLAGREHPDLLTELVDQQLIAEALEADPPEVSDEELQRASDAFRRRNGLLSADATHRWLRELNLSVADFEDLLTGVVQRRKHETRITDGRVRPYFESHREDFEIVQALRVRVPDQAIAARLVTAAREAGLYAATTTAQAADQDPRLEATLASWHARDLPGVLRAARPGTLVGPASDATGCWVAEVLRRAPARLDAATRAHIRARLLREWLDERRARAAVSWYGLTSEEPPAFDDKR